MTTTRYYQINGEFHTYEYWHDHEGYTDHATTAMTYKTTNPWGGTASSSGYYDHPDSDYDFMHRTFFISGVVGWLSPNALALEGYFPSDAVEFLAVKNGVVSNAAYIEDPETGDPNDTVYLVEAEINTGWMSADEYSASGWQPYTPDDDTPKGYIVVGSNGTIQHSIPLGDMYLHQIQHSIEMVDFYFTSNGAAETENTLLESGVDAPLYTADGSAADDDLYDGSGASTYTQANGNMFAPDGGDDLITLQNGQLYLTPDGDRLALSMQASEWQPVSHNVALFGAISMYNSTYMYVKKLPFGVAEVWTPSP